jgi:hypothetical protein
LSGTEPGVTEAVTTTSGAIAPDSGTETKLVVMFRQQHTKHNNTDFTNLVRMVWRHHILTRCMGKTERLNGNYQETANNVKRDSAPTLAAVQKAQKMTIPARQ